MLLAAPKHRLQAERTQVSVRLKRHMTRVGLAVNLLRRGKVHPTELLGNDPIKGQADFVRILDLAKADAKGKE